MVLQFTFLCRTRSSSFFGCSRVGGHQYLGCAEYWYPQAVARFEPESEIRLADSIYRKTEAGDDTHAV